jgi:hypothetical protein
MTVSFQNPGLIDLRAIQIMGVSVKETDNPIGCFGTGLKYAIAVLLRMGQSITVYRGLEPHRFTSAPENIRGKWFQVVRMNSEPLGITTDLGKNWQMWQAFREIYANNLDEKGSHALGALTPNADTTTVQVEGDAFASEYARRNSIFLGSKPIFEGVTADVHHGSSAHVFYRGVRVATLQKPSLYTYNIKGQMDLTEDRTLAELWKADYRIGYSLISCQDATLLRNILGAKPGTLERDSLDFGTSFDPSEEFIQVVKQLGVRCNSSARALLEKKKLLVKSYIPCTPTRVEAMSLTRAWAFLERRGLADRSIYPMQTVVDLGEGILGLAKDGTIYLSKAALQQGTKQMASTLLEEFLHLKHGFADMTREMQTFLFDLVISMGEEINGEPL